MSIAQSGVVGILGPNGAGKTSLFRVSIGVLRPSAGTVSVGGIKLGDPKWVQAIARVGYLPQEIQFQGAMRVEEFVSWMGWLKNVPSSLLEASVDDALETVGLGPVRGDAVRTLSGGMKRRLGIAQALVNRPALLIFDEPTAGLDPLQRALFRDLIPSLGSRSVVLLSTHIAEDIVTMCDHVMMLVEGELVAKWSIQEIHEMAAHNSIAPSHVLEREMIAYVERAAEQRREREATL